LSIVVHELGDPAGRPLVCVHGVTAHGGRFAGLAARLPGRRILAPDLRGHGSSTDLPPWDVEQHVEDLADAIEVERADWLGHSFGGRLVVELAARHPGRVERAVLLDPALRVLPHVGRDMAGNEHPQPSWGSIDEAVDARLASGRLFHTPRRLLEEELPAFLEQGRDGRFRYRHSRAAVVAAWSEMVRPPPPWPRIPTLLLLGAQSLLVLDEDRAAYEAALGDLLRVVEVPGGHVVLWDALEETSAAVREFLEDSRA
jgi:lipase